MDDFVNGYALFGTGSASVVSHKLRNKYLFNLELPPLYPWAPDVSRTAYNNLSGSRSFNGLSTGSSTSSELPAESEFLPAASQTGPAKHRETVLPQRYLISSEQDEHSQFDYSSANQSSSNSSTPHVSPTHNSKLPVISTSSHGYGVPQHPKKLQLTARRHNVDKAVQTETGLESKKKNSHVSLLVLCKEMVTMTVDRLQRQAESDTDGESLVHRILASCESVKVAVVNILESYAQAQKKDFSESVFADSDLVRVMSMQTVAALELVVSLTAVWTSLYDNPSLTSVNVISESIREIVKELATEMLVFLQSCANNCNEEAHSSSAQIMELLYQLVKQCGQLALATDSCPSSFCDPEMDVASDAGKDNDLIHMEPSSDVKEVFLRGTNLHLDEVLESSLHAIESSETRAESLTPDDSGASKCEANSDVLKHVYIAVATSKLLVLKTQQIQVELDSELRSDQMPSDQYFLQFFKRCQSLLLHVTRLSDNLTLLVQAAEPLASEKEPDPGTLMKICRCSELIQRTAQRLIIAPISDDKKQNLDNSINQSALSSANGFSLDSSSVMSCESATSAILSSKQLSELESSGDDVILATRALIELCRKHLIPFKGMGFRVKRMLPVTPSGIHSVARCQSARSLEKRSLSRNLSEADVSQDTHD